MSATDNPPRPAPGAATAPARPAETAVVGMDQPIYTFDIDFAGVVSNINYLKWSEIWRLEFARRMGMTVPDMLKVGLLPLMVRHELNFRRALRYGESARLEGWVERIGTSSVTMWLEMREAGSGELACENRQVMVIVDLKTRQPVPIPDGFRAKLQEHM
ncbi:MAG: acyl-CoA thioesterase [Candidatus Eisenbacteria bacterium]|nr:acyl-CoA thioesterase [Candidatus Eisenbacteria bacterium]